MSLGENPGPALSLWMPGLEGAKFGMRIVVEFLASKNLHHCYGDQA